MTAKKKKNRISLISWNVNGLRAAIKKDFFGAFKQLDADIVALQETKLQHPQLTPEITDIQAYESHWSHATVKKGYSGVAAYTRIKPQKRETRHRRTPDTMMKGVFWSWISMILFFLMYTFPTDR